MDHISLEEIDGEEIPTFLRHRITWESSITEGEEGRGQKNEKEDIRKGNKHKSNAPMSKTLGRCSFITYNHENLLSLSLSLSLSLEEEEEEMSECINMSFLRCIKILLRDNKNIFAA